jgi:hypothetical protein
MFDKLDPDIRKFILTYDKGDSNYTIDEVFEYWQKNVRK